MFFDGFEENDIEFMNSFWGMPDLGVVQTFSTTKVHKTAGGNGGTYSMACNGARTITPVISTDHRWIHIWMDPTDLGVVNSAYLQFLLNSTEAFTIAWNPASTTIRLRRGDHTGTLVAESAAGTFTNATTTHWWIFVNCANVGGSVAVYKGNDAAATVSFSGDTTALSSDGWHQAQINSEGGGVAWIDDFIILTDAEKIARYGAGSPSPQKELYSIKYLPSGDNTVALTPVGAPTNWQAASTRPFSPAIYNLGTSAPKTDTYTFTTPTTYTITSLGGVKVMNYAGRQGRLYDMNSVLVSGATTSHGSTSQLVASGSLSYAYATREAMYPTDPNTAGIWTALNFFASKFGVRNPS